MTGRLAPLAVVAPALVLISVPSPRYAAASLALYVALRFAGARKVAVVAIVMATVLTLLVQPQLRPTASAPAHTHDDGR
jgi:hypothetical protein